MVKSMTGFAAAKGEGTGYTWAWDIRSVNARGLDIRLRMPDWIEGLEARVRAAVAAAVARGSVTLSLRLARDDSDTADRIDATALSRVLDQVAQVEAAAVAAGMTLVPTRAADILTQRGVLTSAAAEADTTALGQALLRDLPDLIDAFDTMRRAEGTALHGVIADQLTRIAALVETATVQADARRDQTAARLRDQLARVMDNSDGADPDRVAQELALIAVKTDVTEELDRLTAHIAAARDLLAADGPVGRKLDFLAQEFNREANTLCSKSQSAELTRTGLDLKATIDQMREQVQNVE